PPSPSRRQLSPPPQDEGGTRTATRGSKSLVERLVAAAARVADGRERGRRLARRRRRDGLIERNLDRAELHALQLVGREPVEWLPRRNAQRRFQQLPAATHLDGVLRQPPDIALHDIELLGRVARFQRLLALLAEPDLMHQHVRLGWHVAARAGEQQERA